MILIYFSMILLIISIPLLVMAKQCNPCIQEDRWIRSSVRARLQMYIFNGDLEEKRKLLAKNGRF